MALQPGTQLGPYQILSALGAGGMGEVHRARDTKLGRDVALKVLPQAFSGDSERMARFQREAQVLAALNQPNIAAIYGLEDSGAVRALVMELVEGPTLADMVAARHGVPLDDALNIAKQIAEALEYAHERGIIHRDLKPANVKVTPEGTIKVLDFGLAKALDIGAGLVPPSSAGAIYDSPLQNSPTLTAAATQAGVIIGTAAYMSPEQARGKVVDRRADIWAFGCVLYEMLAGQRAFEGETVTDTLAAVVRAEPDWAALPATTPARIQNLLRRCLTKDPKQRLRDIGEARIAIEETLSGTDSVAALSSAPSPGVQRPPLQPWRRALPWAAGAFLGAVAATLAIIFFLRPSSPGERMQFAVPFPAEVGHLALSPDGRMLAFVARDESSGEDMVHVVRVGSPEAQVLAGTEGASYPFWSPDDAYVGFFANGKLKKIPAGGGPAQALATASYGRGGSWGTRGVIIYAPEAGGYLWRVNADGTQAAPLTDKLFLPSENSHRWPLFLPDGDHFLFWAGAFGASHTEPLNGIYLSSLAAKDKQLVVSGRSNPGYADGHLYYANEGKSLIAVPFDAGRGAVSGEPVVVAGRVTFQPSVFWGSFAVGGHDTVVYSTSTGASLSALVWYDGAGKELSRVGEPGILANPSISPDGKHATVDIADLKTSNVDIWIDDLEHKTSSRFTFDPAEEATGVWARDGQLIAYRSIASGSAEMMIKQASGVEAPRKIYSAPQGDDIMPNSWEASDHQILCAYQPATGGSDLVLLDVATGKMTPFIATKANETNGQISPDGKWVAYASNESGDWEVYVTTFPSAQGKWQVSHGGGTEPRWRGDGKEIYYVDLKGTLRAVPVSTNGTFSSGAPSALFQVQGRAPVSSTDFFTYDVSRDGKRFLVNRYVKPEHIEPLTVLLNAAVGMKK